MSRLLIRNGRLIDPANRIDDKVDLLVDDGKIAAILPENHSLNDTDVLDASGKITIGREDSLTGSEKS